MVSRHNIDFKKLVLQCLLVFNGVTAWKVSKYGVFSGPYFSAFGLNTENMDQKNLRIWTLFTQWELFERKCATALVFWFGITTPVDIIVISLEKSSDLIVFFHEMVKIIVDFLKYWLLQNSFNEKFPPAKVFILCHIK